MSFQCLYLSHVVANVVLLVKERAYWLNVFQSIIIIVPCLMGTTKTVMCLRTKHNIYQTFVLGELSLFLWVILY